MNTNRLIANKRFRKIVALVITLTLVMQFGSGLKALDETSDAPVPPSVVAPEGTGSDNGDVNPEDSLVKPGTDGVDDQPASVTLPEPTQGEAASPSGTQVPQSTSRSVPSVFEIVWLEGGLNTSSRQEGEISGDNQEIMDITPYDNDRVRPAIYQINFTMGGDRDAAPGEIEIRLPKSIFSGRDGQPVDEIKLPIVQAPEIGGATNFHYWIDTETDEIVVTNYENFLRTESFTVAIENDFWPYQVADGYSNPNIQAKVSIQQDAGTEPIQAESNTLEVNVHTTAKLKQVRKQNYGRLETWDPAWGEKPEDADDYFYVMWQLRIDKPMNNTQPFEVKYVDVADPLGEIVAFSETRAHWVISPPSSWTLNTQQPDGTDIFSNKVFYNENKPTNQNSDNKIVTYIITKYHKDLGVDGKVFRNTFTANLTGVDGAHDTKSASTSFTYKPPAQYIGDGIAQNKRSGSSILTSGMLDALEKGNNVRPLGSYNDSFYVTAQAYRAKDISQDGTKDYTLEIVDNVMGLRQYDLNGNPREPWFELLTPGTDFNYIHAYVNLTEYDSTYDINKGYTSVEAKDYQNYKPIELYVQQDGGSSWTKLGEFKRNGSSDQYDFTRPDGTVEKYTSRYKPVTLPSNTTNIKFVYTGKRYGAKVEGHFGIQINSTDTVRAAVQRAKDAEENTLNFYNISTMGVKDSEGNYANQTDKFAIDNGSAYYPENVKDAVKAQAREMTGVDGAYLEHTSSYIGLKWLHVSSWLGKTNKKPVSDSVNGREIVDYTLTMRESVTLDKNTIPEEQAEEWGLVSEQNRGVFYDLLPPGTWALKDSIKAYTVDYYWNGYSATSYRGVPCAHQVEFFPDWRGSGMTMMKITVKAPMEHNLVRRGMTGQNYMLFSGFIVDFQVANPWDNILDSGKTMWNSVAYQTGADSLAQGLTDINPNTTIQEKAWFEDVNEDNDPNEKQFLYAENKLNLTPLIATEIGFTKKVKSVDEPVFGSLSEVPVGGKYVYRLRYAVNKNTQSKNVVIYDILENAYGDHTHWQGTFDRIDLRHAIEKNIEPVVYYSTRNDLNPRDNPDDGDLTNGEIWTTEEPADKSTIKAIAVDLSKMKGGGDYIFPAEATLPLYVYMDAPNSGVPVTNPPVHAYNDAYIRAVNIVGTGVNVDLNEKTDVVRVYMREFEMDIEKTANPASGTFEDPTDLRANDNKLTYTLNITDKNKKDTARNIVVEDVLPDGLVLDGEIQFKFGQDGDSGLISESNTIHFNQDGQKLTFTIDKLFAENNLELTIPVRVDPSTIVGVHRPVFQNQAMITSVGGREFDVASETTYHKTEIPVEVVAKKVWDDGNNLGGVRPENVKVTLHANGTQVGEVVTLSEDNNWENKWSGLPCSDDEGKPIDYSIEEKPVNHYETVIEESLDETTGEKVFRVINQYESTNRTVKKIWEDDNNKRGKRPSDIKVQLLQDGIPYQDEIDLNASNGWTHTWEGIPLKNEDTLYTYTIREIPVDGYETTIKEEIDPETNGLVFEVTNEYKTTSRTIEKRWDDRGNVLELRPESVKVQLKANGTNHGGPVTLNEDNNWHHQWDDLEILDDDGRPIEYSVEEEYLKDYQHEIEKIVEEVPGGHDEEGNPEPTFIDKGFIMTNTLEFTDRFVFKIWEDEEDAAGKRPDSITVQLLQDGRAYGEPVVLNDENNWAHRWEDLPATKGQVYYDYDLHEIPVENYRAEIETLYNSDEENEQSEIIYFVTNIYDRLEVSATKKWEGLPVDENGSTPDGPPVLLQLKQNGENFGDAVQVEDTGSHETTYTWSNLIKHAPDGSEYTYTVEEPTVPKGYVKTQEGNTITNTYNGVGEKDPIEFTATKKWEGLPEGTNGVAVSLQLKQNGADYGEAVQVEDNGSHEASHTWNDLPKYAPDGSPYTYTADETTVPNGYVKTQAGNIITNTYNGVGEEEPVQFTATKKWEGLPEGANGATVSLQLKQNDANYGSSVQIEDMGIHETTYTWMNLPKYAPDGTAYTYTVDEATVPNGYVKVQEGNAITNTYNGVGEEEPVEITATKKWEGLPEGANGAAVSLKLKQNDVDYGEAVQLEDTGSHEATHTWNNLPKYAPDGTAYSYTVDEVTVPNGYVKIQEGNTITNTYNGVGEEEPIEITATKKWEGLPEGANGATVSLQLKQNDADYGEAVQVEDSGSHEASHTWNDLPKYAPDGTAYTYTVDEATVPNGYVKAQEGNTVTNTYNGTGEEEPVQITATKKWEGLPEGTNGATVSLQLKQNDTDYGDAVQVEDSGSHEASHTWNNLPKYAPDGTAYTYTVDEATVPNGYVKAQEGNTITNTYNGTGEEEPVEITATKKWEGLPEGANGATVSLQLKQNQTK